MIKAADGCDGSASAVEGTLTVAGVASLENGGRPSNSRQDRISANADKERRQGRTHVYSARGRGDPTNQQKR
jgi:hypothetical protein